MLADACNLLPCLVRGAEAVLRAAGYSEPELDRMVKAGHVAVMSKL